MSEVIAAAKSMPVRLRARSVSGSLPLRSGVAAQRWRVLAVFERACNLLLPTFDAGPAVVASLVWPALGDGPGNIVVPGDLDWRTRLAAGDTLIYERERLWGDGVDVALAGAVRRSSRPPWERYRVADMAARRGAALACAQQCAPAGSLLQLLPGAETAACDMWLKAAQRALVAADAGRRDDLSYLRSLAEELAGLGPGLTPAGDDFLAGIMLWLWCAVPAPEALCRAIVERAAPRTNRLSAAFLRSAAAGECGVAWHRLLRVLAPPPVGGLAVAVRAVLRHGHTSGADALAGFLWMARPLLP